MQCQLQRPTKDFNSFRSSIKHELVELYHKTNTFITTETNLGSNPVSAYNDALYLLEILFNSAIPIPQINQTKQGSISLKWYTEQGTATMDLCGNGLVIYDVFADEDLYAEGSCVLTESTSLDELLGSLRNIFSYIPMK